VLWVKRPAGEKGADVDVGCATPRGRVQFMPDEDALRIRLTGQKPPISVGAAIKLSRLTDMASAFLACAYQIRRS
jgi:hypothetical protein